MAIGLSVTIAFFSMVAVFNIYSVWKLLGIFKAFDEVIIKTLTDTTMIERHKMFVDALTKFGDNDRKRKDKEFSDMKLLTKTLETDLRTVKNLIDGLKKGS